jgi:NADH:ubiquinone oxidoreductase subunit 5 (subunit L)/multisubunit Na+/H+ antiporter MnhA subunit
LFAYSTMSNCGVMVMLSGFGNMWAVVVYIILHGLIKAGGFFCISAFITFYKTQDIRGMGGGAVFLKVQSLLLFFCLFNMGCFPLSIGYILKDLGGIYICYGFFDLFDIGCLILSFICSLSYIMKVYFFLLFDILKTCYKINPFKLMSINTKWSLCFLFRVNYFFSVFIIISGGFLFSVLVIWFCKINYIDIFDLCYGEVELFVDYWLIFDIYLSYYLTLYTLYIQLFIIYLILVVSNKFSVLENFYFIYFIFVFMIIL